MQNCLLSGFFVIDGWRARKALGSTDFSSAEQSFQPKQQNV
jgi:hypothetical protein